MREAVLQEFVSCPISPVAKEANTWATTPSRMMGMEVGYWARGFSRIEAWEAKDEKCHEKITRSCSSETNRSSENK